MSLERFEEFFADVGARLARPMTLEPFQRDLIAETFGAQREVLALLPRGQGKSTLMAARGLFELVTVPDAEVFCAAASREQAEVVFATARRLAMAHPAIQREVTVTRRELRTRDGLLKVLPSEAGHVYGLAPTLVLVDELAWHKTDDLYVALRSSVHKRHARLITISTAGGGSEGPLHELRKRALALPETERTGALTVCRGEHMVMHEWAAPPETKVDDLDAFALANPASWVSTTDLEELRAGLPEHDFKMLHGNIWVDSKQPWLPAGAWAACRADYEIEDGEDIVVGIDVGGARSDSAVIWCTPDLRIGCEIYSGDSSILDVSDCVAELASRFRIVEVLGDHFRLGESLFRLRERGIEVATYPTTDARMVPASSRLFDSITQGTLRHPGHEALDRHVATAVAKRTLRGWRVDKATARDRIDGVISLAVAVDRALEGIPQLELLGWL